MAPPPAVTAAPLSLVPSPSWTSASDDAALQFLELIWHLEQGLAQASDRMLATLGITGPQRFALRVIRTTPGLTAAELGRRLHLRPGRTRGAVAHLESAGLILRKRQAADGRIWRLYLTVKGKRLSRQASRGTIEDHVRRVLRRHSDETRTAANTLLSNLANHLNRL